MPELYHKPLRRGGKRAKSVAVDEANPLPVWVTHGPESEKAASGQLAAVGQAIDLHWGDGRGALAVQIEGTYVGTVIIEGTVGGRVYVTLATLTTSTLLTMNVSGLAAARARMSAYTSGAAYVTLRASVGQSLGGGGTTTIVDTELAAARLAADNLALPTAPDVLATNLLYDGSTLDLARAATPSTSSMTVGAVPGAVYVLNSATQTDFMPIEGYLFNADGKTTSIRTPAIAGLKGSYNATTWDRDRNNISVVSLASSARTTTQTGSDIITYNARYLKVILDMTTVGTGSVTLTIQGKAAVGTYYTLLVGAAVTSNSTNVYEIGVGLPVTANVSANVALPRTLRLVVTANNANSAVYSLDYDLAV